MNKFIIQTAWVVAKIRESESAINRLMFNAKLNIVKFQELLNIISYPWPKDMNRSTAEFLRLFTPYNNTIRLDPALNSSREVESLAGTQIKYCPPFVELYCFPKNINIQNTTHDCPPYPFKILMNLKWKTDDASYAPEEFHVIHESIIPPLTAMNLSVFNEHFDAPTVIKTINHLNEQLKLSLLSKPVMNMPLIDSNINLMHICIAAIIFNVVLIGLIVLLNRKPNGPVIEMRDEPMRTFNLKSP